ncbi:hypothetical protein ON010_g5238 [Phytophthora cinnamomi]|nr:hypothetical protein ON010_g5238 [Phytophthora cinnamomi]
MQITAPLVMEAVSNANHCTVGGAGVPKHDHGELRFISLQLVSSPRLTMFPPGGYDAHPLGLSKTTFSSLLQQVKRSEYHSVFREVGGKADDPFRGQTR